MGGRTGVYVQGLREMHRAMERAGVDVEDLKDVMGRVADEATQTMRPFMPHKSGALQGSARGNRAKAKAVVTIGRARVQYAGPINYGWPRRNIRGANFTGKTDEVMETKAPQILEQGWADIAKKNGLI